MKANIMSTIKFTIDHWPSPIKLIIKVSIMTTIKIRRALAQGVLDLQQVW